MSDLTMFGYPARLVIDLPDGDDTRPHDVSGCVEIIPSDETRSGGFWIDPADLLTEIEIEKRTRARVGLERSTAAPEDGRTVST